MRFKKVNRVIKFNQNAWLKPYTDINTDLSKKAKNDCWWIIQFLERLWKILENIEKLNLLQQKQEKILSNYHTKKFFTKKFVAIEMRKTDVLLN